MKSIVEKSREIDPYDTIKEDGTLLQDEEQTKEYIANYFENLYQARGSKSEYANKTIEIENKVKQIEAEMSNNPDIDDFTEDEINNAIRKLKRKKSTGPDDIPNELFIEANENTKKIISNAYNKINAGLLIPEEWQKGEMCRLY